MIIADEHEIELTDIIKQSRLFKNHNTIVNKPNNIRTYYRCRTNTGDIFIKCYTTEEAHSKAEEYFSIYPIIGLGW